MFRSTWSIAVTCFLLQPALAAPATTAPAALPTSASTNVVRPDMTKVPVILVEKPVHDWGEVWVGELRHTFTVKNMGQSELRITRVKTSCGCAVADDYPKVIGPGYSGGIPLKVNSERYRGRFSVTVTVDTNDPAHKETKLILSAAVKHYATVSPTSATFGNVRGDSVMTKTLTLTNNTDIPMKPSMVDGPKSETFKGELRELEAGKKYELTVTASPPYKPKYNSFMLPIDLGIPNAPPFKVRCNANLPDRLDVSRQIIYVPTDRPLSPQKIDFTNNGEGLVKLVSAAALDDKLQVTSAVKEEGRHYEITVTAPPGYRPPAAGTSIVLKTDDTEKPELRIPVRPYPSRNTAGKKPPVRLPRSASKMLGKPAPAVAVKTYDDKQVTLGGKSDKVKLVTFYASWCGYCKKALPYVEKIHQQYKDKGVEVIAVNTDSRSGRGARTKEQSMELYNQLKLSMPMTMDADVDANLRQVFSMNGTADKTTTATGVPTFFVVDKDGRVEAVHVGYTAVVDGTVPKELDQLLAGKKLPKPEPQKPAAGS